MKRFLFLLLFTGLTTGWAKPPADTNRAADSPAIQQDTALADDGEAGGISGTVTDTGKDEPGIPWLPVALGFAAGAVIAAVAMKLLAGKPKERPAVQQTIAAAQRPEEEAGGRQKQDQRLKQQLSALLKEKDSLQQQLDRHSSFDNEYYNEAFRKLVAPMNDAMEKGSRREIVENLVKIMCHYSSLTRYKIAKKQPYDEANINYLLNRKGSAEGQAIEIDGQTPVDKIPKHIKVLLDLLKEQGSGGLDDSIVSGYRIRNI